MKGYGEETPKLPNNQPTRRFFRACKHDLHFLRFINLFLPVLMKLTTQRLCITLLHYFNGTVPDYVSRISIEPECSITETTLCENESEIYVMSLM